MFINQLRVMKFLKRGFKLTLKNPSYFFNKNKRTIKFHFDMWHGENYLSEAIKLNLKDCLNIEFRICQTCTEKSLKTENGCYVCLECGYSKCDK